MPVHRILFVCYGNICRSTMAQSVMEHLVRQAGREDEFRIDSAATSTASLGKPPHPGTKRVLARAGIPLVPHTARQVQAGEYDSWDLIIGMEEMNVRDLLAIFGGDPDGRVRTLLSRDIPDPWWTHDYESSFNDIIEGCTELLRELQP